MNMILLLIEKYYKDFLCNYIMDSTAIYSPFFIFRI